MKATFLVVVLLLAVVGAQIDSRWKLMFFDDFTGSTLNTQYWTALDTTTVYNNEQEWYSSQNVYVQNSNLVLKTNPDSTYPSQPYKSGRVETQDKYLITFARVDIYAKLPFGNGLWPAHWLLNNNDCDNSEVDIMENLGSQPDICYGSYHYASTCTGTDATQGNQYTASSPLSNGYHLYTVEMNATDFVFKVDNVAYGTVTQGTSDYTQDPHKLILNTAVSCASCWGGGVTGSTTWPQYHYIDYVKIYGWQPCVTGCGAHGCCNQATQTCTCDSNYAGTNCEYQVTSSGTKAVCSAATTAPTTKPTAAPTAKPTSKPTTAPTSKPTTAPTSKPATSAPTSYTMTANSVSPTSVTPGTSVTVSTTVNSGNTAVSGGYFGFYIAPANAMDDSANILKIVDAITIAANTQKTFSWTYPISTCALPGTYWLTVVTWNSAWSNVFWQTNVATLTVTSNGAATACLTSISPNAALPGASVTAVVSIHLGATAVSNGFVSFYVGPPGLTQNSQKIVEQIQSGVTLAAYSTTSFSLTAPVNSSAAHGSSYTVYAGCWDSNWNTLAWATGLATFVVKSSKAPYLGPFSQSAIAIGPMVPFTITMAATAGSSALSGANIGYGIQLATNSDNSEDVTGQQVVVNIAAGATVTQSFNAQIPSGTAPGTYRIDFGFWDSNWNTLEWNNQGLTITVTK